MIKDLAVEEILAALGEVKSVTLKPGEVLFREGDEAHAMYIVRHGTLRILSGSTILETVRDGCLLGEMAIIEEHMPRSATVIAGTVLFLCSDLASAITGAQYVVDGGRTATGGAVTQALEQR